MIVLQNFPASRFEEFQLASVYEYAQDLVTNRGMEEQAAIAQAQEGIHKAFPEGKSTDKNKLLSILKQTEESETEIGYVWYALQEDNSAFIFDFLIYSEHRGKGYASKALEALHETLRGQGLNRIGLRVAPDNQAAIKAYYRAGFNVTGWNMSSNL